MQPRGGRVLGGRFVLERELGRGGMGVVHVARDLTTGRAVALKVVQAALADPEGRARFAREAQLTAALRHPGIVTVHSAGEVDGRPFIAYELVEGARELHEALAGLDRPARVLLVRDVARALGHAHARGVVHRDVKPQNVLVDAQGRARVADFGLATAAGLERLTRTGEVVGTPAFMAPEQLNGEREVGPPADVWAVGVVLYRALTGAAPFEGDTFMKLAERVLRGGPPRAPRALDGTISPPLEAVVLTALRRDARDRYPDGEALAAALDAALVARDAPPLRRRALGLACAVAVAGALLLAVTGPAPTPPLDPRAATTATPAAPTTDEPRVVPAVASSEVEPPDELRPGGSTDDDEATPLDDPLLASGEAFRAFLTGAQLRKQGRLEEAAGYFKVAADLGHAHAATILGKFHRDGKGVQKDLTRALEYLLVAAELGDAEGLDTLTRLAGARRDEALAGVREVTRLRPENARAWVLLGELMVADGAHAEAVQAFRRAIRLAEPRALVGDEGAASVIAGANFGIKRATAPR